MLTLASLVGGSAFSYSAAAIPLAPLGKGTDTVGGAKLPQPSLRQVQVRDPRLQYFALAGALPLACVLVWHAQL